MEVWVLEEYFPQERTSNTLNVFENADVAMNTVNSHEDIIWFELKDEDTIYCYMSNLLSDIIYYLNKFEVVLDEMPIVKN
jgi:hypothetical protein